MTGPYGNPPHGDKIRCPNCGSSEVECHDKPLHHHVCNDCGYSTPPAEAIARARGDQP